MGADLRFGRRRRRGVAPGVREGLLCHGRPRQRGGQPAATAPFRLRVAGVPGAVRGAPAPGRAPVLARCLLPSPLLLRPWQMWIGLCLAAAAGRLFDLHHAVVREGPSTAPSAGQPVAGPCAMPGPLPPASVPPRAAADATAATRLRPTYLSEVPDQELGCITICLRSEFSMEFSTAGQLSPR